jgi:AcrR family transcriptional regulator
VIGYHLLLRNTYETGFVLEKNSLSHITKTKPRKQRNLRDALLELAVAQVAEHGSDGLLVAQLARTLSISTAAPYRHFADRAALVHAVATIGLNRLGTAMSAAANAVSSPGPQRIVAIGQAYLDFAQAEPNLFNTMFGSPRPVMPTEQSKRLQDAGHATFDILLHHVTETLGHPKDAAKPRRIAFALWSFVHGQAALRLINADQVIGPATNRDIVMKEVANLLLSSISATKVE